MEAQSRYAGFWIRFLAWIIDWAIYAILGLLFYFIFWKDIPVYEPLDMLSFITTGIQGFIIYALIQFLYEVLLTVHLGGTLGKIAVGAYVRKEEAPRENISFGQAIGRYLFKYFISAPFFYLGYIFVGFDKYKQGWHDRIARTIVVTKGSPIPVTTDGEGPEPYKPPPPPPPPPPVKYGVLTITKGTGRGTSIDLRGPRTLIGSDSKCDIVLDNENHYVSRQHCEIFLRGKDVYLRHLSHVNPTMINHVKVTEQMLRDNDLITVSDFELRYKELPRTR